MVTFKPAHTYIVWPDFTGLRGLLVYANSFEVTSGGALIFTSRGDDGERYVTRVVSPTAYAHMSQMDGASGDTVSAAALP